MCFPNEVRINPKPCKEDYFVHRTAIVDDGAKIGKDTRIWHWCHIMKDVEIGEHCNIGEHVFIESGVNLGNNVKVKNNVAIYTGVTCEDDVFLGPNCVFTNVVNPRSFIERKNEFRKTYICKGASVGANATIVCGHKIGKYAFVAAGAVVASDIKPYALVMGVPAKQVGWVCECGEQLDNDLVCNRCGKKYLQNSNGLIEKSGGGCKIS